MPAKITVSVYDYLVNLLDNAKFCNLHACWFSLSNCGEDETLVCPRVQAGIEINIRQKWLFKLGMKKIFLIYLSFLPPGLKELKFYYSVVLPPVNFWDTLIRNRFNLP